jgi:hypothetical protein
MGQCLHGSFAASSTDFASDFDLDVCFESSSEKGFVVSFVCDSLLEDFAVLSVFRFGCSMLVVDE